MSLPRSVMMLTALLITPLQTHAQVITKTIGLFNIFVGLMLTAAILTYVIGFIIWSCRLGSWPSYRTEAVKVMEWSVAILFVLVVLLSIVQFIQNHAETARYVGSVIVVIVVIGIGIAALAQSQSGPSSPERPQRPPNTP